MLIIFDKDGTLVDAIGKRPANTLREQVLIPGVLEKCQQLRAEAHKLVADVARQIGASYYAVCVCHPKGTVPAVTRESNFRKPNPGMLLYLADKLGFEQQMYVGDRAEDLVTAKRAGIKFKWAHDFFARPAAVG